MLVDGTIENTIKAVLRLGWYRLNLRRSLVEEPLFERNIIPDSVPPVIHWEINSGNQIKVTMGLKGGGAENMSTLKMMPATSTVEQIKQAVVETVVNAGGKACPPVLVGVGIGGNYESCALMAKRALFEELGRAHPDPRYATLEKEILAEINRQGRGVMGMGEGPAPWQCISRRLLATSLHYRWRSIWIVTPTGITVLPSRFHVKHRLCL